MSVETIKAKKIHKFLDEELFYGIVDTKVRNALELLADWEGTNLFIESTQIHGMRWISFKINSTEFCIDLYLGVLNRWINHEKQKSIGLSSDSSQYFLAKILKQEIDNGKT